MSVKIKYRSLAFPAVMAVIFCSLPLIHAAVRPTEADKAKARHYLNSALAESSKENAIIYSSLFRRAADLDSTDEYIRFIKGQDAGIPAVSVRMMRPYAEKHPTDRYVAMPFIGALVGNEEMDEAVERMQMLVKARPEDMDVRNMEMQLWTLLDSVERAEAVIDFMKEIGLDDAEENMLRLSLIAHDEEKLDTALLLTQMHDYSVAHPEDTLAFSHYIFSVFSIDNRKGRDILAAQIEAEPEKPFNYYIQLALDNHEEDIEAVTESAMKFMAIPTADPSALAGFFFEEKNEAYSSLFDTIAARYPENNAVQEKYLMYNFGLGQYDKVDSIVSSGRVEMTNPSVVAAAMNSRMMSDNPAKALEIYNSAKASGVSTDYCESMLPTVYLLLKDEKNFMAWRDSVCEVRLKGISPVDTLMPLPYKDIIANLEELKQVYEIEGELYHRLGDIDKCLLAYRNALTLMPDDAEVLNNYAYFVALTSDDPDDLEQARSMAAKAVDIAADTNAFDTLAYILFKQGETDKAIGLQEELLSVLDPDAPSIADVHDHLGDFYFAKGDINKAVELWKKALSFNIDNPIISEKIISRKYIPEPFGDVK